MHQFPGNKKCSNSSQETALEGRDFMANSWGKLLIQKGFSNTEAVSDWMRSGPCVLCDSVPVRGPIAGQDGLLSGPPNVQRLLGAGHLESVSTSDSR